MPTCSTDVEGMNEKSFDTIVKELFQEDGYIHTTLKKNLKDEDDENVKKMAIALSTEITGELEKGTESFLEYLETKSPQLDENGVGMALIEYNGDNDTEKPAGYEEFINKLGCLNPPDDDPNVAKMAPILQRFIIGAFDEAVPEGMMGGRRRRRRV